MKHSRNILLLTSLYFLLYSCQKHEKVRYPQYKSITESVYAPVTVEPLGSYKVYAAAHGIVEKVFIKEGARVSEGDSILKLLDYSSSYQMSNAALEVELAKKNLLGESSVLRELENELQLAYLRLESDSLNYYRQGRLWQKRIGSKQEYEQKQITYENSKKHVRNLIQQIERKREELKTNLGKARNNYSNQLSINQEYVVKSKINGTLYELLKEEGEAVNEQEVIANIGSSEQFVLKMQVDEVDIVRLKKGQKIWVSLDAYKDEVFEAVLLTIIPKMNELTQTFRVEGTFINPPKVLYSGLRGEANIIINKKDNVLCIPSSFLFNSNELITEEGTIQVVTGVRDLEYIEILSPIDSSTQIFKP